MLKSKFSRQAGFILIFLLVAASVLLLSTQVKEDESAGPGGGDAFTGAVARHSLADAGQAKFLSIFEYDAAGGVASFMVGGRTELFATFTSAIEKAEPVAGEAGADDSFTNLLVLAYDGASDTLELPYSRSRNLLIFEDQPYRPAENLEPLIIEVQKKLN